MNRLWRRGVCVLLALLLLSSGAHGAGGGSLRVTVADRNGRPGTGVTAAILRAGEPDGSLTAEFQGTGVTPEALLSERDAAATARTLADWAAAHDLSGTEQTADGRGEALFGGLSAGVYLVLCPPGQALTFAPFLARVTGTGETAAHPKAEEPGGPEGPDTPVPPPGPDVPDQPATPAEPVTEPEEPVPPLPQTGRDPLPVCLLAACGAVLAAAGLLELRRDRRERHE